MGTQDKGGGLRKRKGWIGYVWGYKDYCKNTDWEAIDWTDGAPPKSETKDKMGKIIQKW